MVNSYPYGTGHRGADRTVDGLSDCFLKPIWVDHQHLRYASADNHRLIAKRASNSLGFRRPQLVGPVRAKSTVESGSHLDKLKNRFGRAVTLTLCCATIGSLEGDL